MTALTWPMIVLHCRHGLVFAIVIYCVIKRVLRVFLDSHNLSVTDNLRHNDGFSCHAALMKNNASTLSVLLVLSLAETQMQNQSIINSCTRITPVECNNCIVDI